MESCLIPSPCKGPQALSAAALPAGEEVLHPWGQLCLCTPAVSLPGPHWLAASLARLTLPVFLPQLAHSLNPLEYLPLHLQKRQFIL